MTIRDRFVEISRDAGVDITGMPMLVTCEGAGISPDTLVRDLPGGSEDIYVCVGLE